MFSTQPRPRPSGGGMRATVKPPYRAEATEVTAKPVILYRVVLDCLVINMYGLGLLFKVTPRGLRVDHRRPRRPVPQHLLQRRDVAARLDPPAGEGVPQLVRV